jgi:hypothetical protein
MIRYAYTKYVNNYNNSLKTLNHFQQNSEKISQFLSEVQVNPKIRGLSLQSLLIMPVQRLPKYELLLRVKRRGKRGGGGRRREEEEEGGRRAEGGGLSLYRGERRNGLGLPPTRKAMAIQKGREGEERRREEQGGGRGEELAGGRGRGKGKGRRERRGDKN